MDDRSLAHNDAKLATIQVCVSYGPHQRPRTKLDSASYSLTSASNLLTATAQSETARFAELPVMLHIFPANSPVAFQTPGSVCSA